MTFSDSIQNVLLNFAEFRGRATRSEYWYWVLFALCLQVLFQIVDGLVSAPLMGFPPFGF